MKRPIKVKLTGLPHDVRDTIKELEQYFTLTKTSDIISHHEDEEAHAYIIILEVAS